MIGRAVVTGGAGFIGSNLVDRLVDEGGEVLVVDDLSTGRLENLAESRRRGGVHFHQLDVSAPEVGEALRRFTPEVVFHLAAQASVSRSVADPVADALANVVGTVNVLAAAAEAGARRLVFTSTGGALYGDQAKLPTKERSAKRPASPYGISKKIAAEYLPYFQAATGLEWVNLALANVYGPRQNPEGEAGVVSIFARQMLAGRGPTIFGDGEHTRDYVYVEDVVDAFVKAAARGKGRLLNIGTGIETTTLEIHRRLAEITGYRGQVRFGPERAGDLRRSAVDASLAAKHLGWVPFTPLPVGLRLTVDWLHFH